MEKADAIVTPANKWLVPGADDDVYFSVMEKAGEEVEKECTKWVMDKGIVDAGQIVVTKGGGLDCKYILHGICPYYARKFKDRHDKKDAFTRLS